MLTLEQMTQNPEAIKQLTGLQADTFHDLTQKTEAMFTEYREECLKQKPRKRAVGAGQKPSLPIAIRLFALLVYIRLHIPQRAVAVLISGISQSRLSRDIRLLVPLLHKITPVPDVWCEVSEQSTITERIENARVIIDGMEQPVYRSQDEETQKDHYSGKKKCHTLKTQFVTDTEHEIEAISEAFPGSVHDKTLSERVGTIERLGVSSVLFGDKAFQGMGKEEVPVEVKWDDQERSVVNLPIVSVITPKKKPIGGELSKLEKSVNRVISRIRIGVEHCIGWVKNFKVIGTRFRCNHRVYTPILRLVCGFVNLQTRKWKQAAATKGD